MPPVPVRSRSAGVYLPYQAHAPSEVPRNLLNVINRSQRTLAVKGEPWL